MSDADGPDVFSGHVSVGRLTLPRRVVEILARVADERGTTVLDLVREVVAAWALREGPD